ncbi:MAG: hypothetical protein P4L87_10730 [Formivibrio sp.]|nr:hypothetical protein [Formivibrio sp.]
MKNFIDIESGRLLLDGGMVFFCGMGCDEIERSDLVVTDRLNMKNGWVFWSSKNQKIEGIEINLALLFFCGNLRQIGFAFVDFSSGSSFDLKGLHDKFLMGKFGFPKINNERMLSYAFDWGELISEFDPRGGQANIVISWVK